MKKIGLGIAILLFAICLEVSWEGHFSYITTSIGLVGLGMAIFGFFHSENK